MGMRRRTGNEAKSTNRICRPVMFEMATTNCKMASEVGEGAARKVALCSAIVAGFAYVSYSIFKSAFCRRGRGRSRSGDRVTNRASQTDLTLPISNRGLSVLPEGCFITKSVKERIKEFNVNSCDGGDKRVTFSPSFKTRSLQNTPWSSPRILSPVDKSSNNLSRSAENLNMISPPASPRIRRKGSNRTGRHSVTLDCSPPTPMKRTSPSREKEISPEEIKYLQKRMEALYKKARVITQHEAKNLMVVLHSKDDNTLVKTLGVITNCCAFTANLDPLCDVGCPNTLRKFLLHPSLAVQVAATQAIANLSTGQRARKLLQPCTPLLVDHAVDENTTELLRTTSLMALANLALSNLNHEDMSWAVQNFLSMVGEGTPNTRLQALKVLVNMSCNPQMVPYILAARAPKQLPGLLEPKTDPEVLLRLVTLLANVICTTAQEDFKVQDLPFEHKAASPETLYSAIYGHSSVEKLRAKISSLTPNTHDDVRIQAKRILDTLA